MEKKKVIVRMANPLNEELFNLIFRRYPEKEWGSFIKVGFNDAGNTICITLAGIIAPQPVDLNDDLPIVEIQAQYTTRALRIAEKESFAIGFVHTHPQDFETYPSFSDDEMEAYYSGLLNSYTNGKPFVSLIFARDDNTKLSATGRVYWKNKVYEVEDFFIEKEKATIGGYTAKIQLPIDALERTKRLVSQFSIEAANDLANSTVAIIGASGTGSPTIELLARAGIGKLIIVDPDTFDASNLERVHGSTFSDIKRKPLKVEIAGRHVKSINPDCEVILIKGSIPQEIVVEQLLACDIVLGCTDKHYSRVALSDISKRYLIPVIDVGVLMEGKNGAITGQIFQLNRLLPSDPCVYCRNMVDSQIVTQELMSAEEQNRTKEEALKAKEEGREPNVYWKESAQLNTVGYLTTMAASFLTGYAIGYLTKRFGMKYNRIELCIDKTGIQIVEKTELKNDECRCNTTVGVALQNIMATPCIAPKHWEQAELIELQISKTKNKAYGKKWKKR